jgi:membrane-associated HD superfamily phosphohydrolase
VVPIENEADIVTSYQVKAEKVPHYPDEYKLTSIYLKTLQTYFKFTSNLHNNCRENVIAKVQQSIEKKILTLEEKLTKQNNLSEISEKVSIEIIAYNLLGRAFTLDELTKQGEDFRSFLIVVRISVDNIMSVVEKGAKIGAIVISDTFLFGQK